MCVYASVSKLCVVSLFVKFCQGKGGSFKATKIFRHKLNFNVKMKLTVFQCSRMVQKHLPSCNWFGFGIKSQIKSLPIKGHPCNIFKNHSRWITVDNILISKQKQPKAIFLMAYICIYGEIIWKKYMREWYRNEAVCL